MEISYLYKINENNLFSLCLCGGKIFKYLVNTFTMQVKTVDDFVEEIQIIVADSIEGAITLKNIRDYSLEEDDIPTQDIAINIRTDIEGIYDLMDRYKIDSKHTENVFEYANKYAENLQERYVSPAQLKRKISLAKEISAKKTSRTICNIILLGPTIGGVLGSIYAQISETSWSPFEMAAMGCGIGFGLTAWYLISGGDSKKSAKKEKYELEQIPGTKQYEHLLQVTFKKKLLKSS
jgi:hypothetical protein